MLVATLAEFKDWIDYGSGTSDDTELTGNLTAASAWVEWRQGGPLEVTQYTERLWCNGTYVQQGKNPLVSVVSITPEDGGVLSPSSYIVDTTNSLIRFRWGWHGWNVVVYTAGLSAIPYRVKQAGLEVARNLWRPKMGTSERGYPGEDLIPTPMGFAVPRHADELMMADPDGIVPGFA